MRTNVFSAEADRRRAQSAGADKSARPPGGEVAAAPSPTKPKRPPGRPPKYPMMGQAKRSELIELAAQWALGLISTKALRLECDDAPEYLIKRTLGERETMRLVRRRVQDMRESGDYAARLANVHLVHGVNAMSELVRNPQQSAGTRISATQTMSKIAAVNGPRTREDNTAGGFSITINLPGAGAIGFGAQGAMVEGDYVEVDDDA